VSETRRVRPRVVVIEDEFVVSLALKVQAEAVGCEVVGTAGDAESGIEMTRRLRPDVVLMDIGLPDKDGIEATREIMAEAPTRVIVVTAYGDDRVARALDAGACVALVKPVLEAQLKQAIAEAVSGPSDGAGSSQSGEV